MDTDSSSIGKSDGTSGAKPPLLYKYMDRNGLDAIWNLELKLTLPDEANDPFEFVPNEKPEKEEELRAHWCRFKAVPGLSQLSFEDFKREPSYLRNSTQNYVRRFQSICSKHFGVLCLSRTPSSISQWAYYSDAHKGLVLELNPHTEPLSGLPFVPVNYPEPKDRVKSQLAEAMSQEAPLNKLMEELVKCAGQKSPDWEKEEEYRYVIPLVETTDDGVQFIRRRLVNGRIMHFMIIDPSTIRRIILGARSSEEFEREVKKAAMLRGISVTKATIDLKDYRINV